MLLMESYLNQWKVNNHSSEVFKYIKCFNDKSLVDYYQRHGVTSF